MKENETFQNTPIIQNAASIWRVEQSHWHHNNEEEGLSINTRDIYHSSAGTKLSVS